MSKKWNEELILRKLTALIKTLEHFPTQTELANLGYSDLSSAIGRITKSEGKGYEKI